MRIPFAQIDAFSDTPFGGNQAAVMPLSKWLDDAVLQAIAEENNISETAFLVASDRDDAEFELRWFTPSAEVALCGHATLASGHFVLASDTALDRVRFATRQAGVLEVARANTGYTLALPAWAPAPKPLPEIAAALGIAAPVETLWHDKGYALVVVEDEAIVAYCKQLQAELAKQSALGEPVRALLDLKFGKAATKRWGWVKKGAPVIVEVGGRDVAGGNVSVLRRDRLYREDGKLDSAIVARGDFVAGVGAALEEIQTSLHQEARARLEANIVPAADFAAIEAHFTAGKKNPGFLEVQWSKPTGAGLDAVVEKLKALKLTLRNAPMVQSPIDGPCVFTGDVAVERVLVGRSY